MTRINLSRDKKRAEDILSQLADLSFLGFLDTDPTTSELDAMSTGGKGAFWYNTESNVWKGYDGTSVKTFTWS